VRFVEPEFAKSFVSPEYELIILTMPAAVPVAEIEHPPEVSGHE